jgi:hypothetical protein
MTLAHALLAAEAAPDKDKVTPGTLGFVVMFLLAVATFLLVRSMVGHLRKIRYNSRDDAAETPRDHPPDPR